MIKNDKIPLGLYCYETLKIEYLEREGFKMHIKPCIYYEYKEDMLGFCKYFQGEVNDQCKICGINDDLGEE